MTREKTMTRPIKPNDIILGIHKNKNIHIIWVKKINRIDNHLWCHDAAAVGDAWRPCLDEPWLIHVDEWHWETIKKGAKKEEWEKIKFAYEVL